MKSSGLTVLFLLVLRGVPLHGQVVTAPASPAVPAASDFLGDALQQLASSNLETVKFDPAARADFAIPQSAAAAALDSGAQVLRPATPRETVTSLLSHFDHGSHKTGFSIAVTPYTLLRGTPVTWREYAGGDSSASLEHAAFVRFMSRLQLSIAATTGGQSETSTATSGTPANFAIGINAIFFDAGDPRISDAFKAANDALAKVAGDLLEKLKSRGSEIMNAPRNAATIAQLEPDPALLTAANSALKKAERDSWNAAAMGMGYAVRFKSPTGKVDDAKDSGGGVWVNLSEPGFGALRDNSQFLFSASYRYHDTIVKDGITNTQDSFNLGAQLRVGGAAQNYYGQYFYKWEHPKALARTHKNTVEFGVEFKVIENLWLNLAWSNDKDLGGNSVLKTGVRFGFGQKAVLYPNP